MTADEKSPPVALEYVERMGSDLFVYSGRIDRSGSGELINQIASKASSREAITLILCTYGGDAHEAYRMARFLQRAYQFVRIIIAGPCKSAGTLMVTGCHELCMAFTGELGPLDIQLAKPDELFDIGSGIDALRAFDDIKNNYYEAFSDFMLETGRRSSGLISTKTACEIATNLVSDLIKPIAAQVDPYRLAEVGRAMEVAREYALRLDCGNLKLFALERLISGYPSHGFVIDAKEAAELFGNMREPVGSEYRLIVEAGTCAFTPRRR